jgi:hypothetical protein
MKQMTSGMLALAGVFALASCYSYTSEAINNANYNTVQATPQYAVMKVGDSDQLIMRLVNDANNGAVTSYTVSNIGSGVLVHYQDGYRPVFDSKLDTLVKTTDKNAQQYFIVGVAPGLWTFTVTPTSVNTGVSATVQALVTPINLGNGTMSKTSGLNPGDTLTITAPANVVFSQASVPTFAVGPSPAIVGVAADSSSLRVLVAPGDSGILTVTKMNVKQAGTNASQLSLSTLDAITKVPAVTVAPTTASTLTPAFGATMTLALGNNLRFLPTATITIGGRAAYIISRSADSSTATIVPTGGSTGAIAYTNLVLKFLTTVPLSIPGDQNITVGAVSSDANASSIATASTITLPATGVTQVFSDGGAYTAGGPCAIGALGGNGCRYYKIVQATAAGYNWELRWDPNTTTDLGLYLLNSTGTASSGTIADGFSNQAGGAETSAAAGFTVPVGTFFMTVVYYNSGPQPPFFHVKIVGR